MYSPEGPIRVSLSVVSAPEVVIPEDLWGLVSLTEKIPRFIDPSYPEGVFLDNVLAHNIRCCQKAMAMELPPGIRRDLLFRILMLHDLPEIEVGDEISPVKDGVSAVVDRFAEKEEQFAARHFSATDQQLFAEFEKANQYFRGKRAVVADIISEALIARLIDITDGNTVYHYFLSAWVGSELFDGRLTPSSSNEYTFLQAEVLR